ncbi:hypothetical protein CDAR_371421 [Caerostris darwini]|uniref:Secreted protein n=1 Tax=Caerostris darwini TaxID=1538125 RepID=A0AAV4XBD9_9ARAC|nr:hypothetical protein CDAR_371421 [Caerostris darwini]
MQRVPRSTTCTFIQFLSLLVHATRDASLSFTLLRNFRFFFSFFSPFPSGCVSGASPVLHAAHPFHTGKGTPPVGSRLRYKTNFPREINSKCIRCEMFTECFYPDGPGSSRLLGLRFFSRVVLSVMDRKKSGR